MTLQSPDYSITLVRDVPFSIERVYAAWTIPTEMERWLGKVTAYVYVGGRYRFDTPADDGSTNTYTGEYIALEKNRLVSQSFLAGEFEPLEPHSYSSEFIEVRLLDCGPSRTELTFINGWSGSDISDDLRIAAGNAWSEWLDRMEQSLLQRERESSFVS